MSKQSRLSIGLSLALAGVNPASANDLAAETYATHVTPGGEIRLPDAFRQSWSHLGSWLVNDPKAPGFGFHDVYAQPEAVGVFRRTGQFPAAPY